MAERKIPARKMTVTNPCVECKLVVGSDAAYRTGAEGMTVQSALARLLGLLSIDPSALQDVAK